VLALLYRLSVVFLHTDNMILSIQSNLSDASLTLPSDMHLSDTDVVVYSSGNNYGSGLNIIINLSWLC